MSTDLFRGLAARAVRASVLASAFLPGASIADDEWREYRNSHFIAMSNAEEADVLERLHELERFRTAVQVVTSVRIPDDARKSVVVLFRNRGQYLDYAPGFNVAGHVVRGNPDLPPVILMPVDQARMNSNFVVRHEFVHALLVHHPIRFPRWYEEGFAEFLSTVQFEGNQVVIGLPPRDRARHALELLPFEEIMAEDFNPHRRTAQFGDAYLQYWLLVDYLLLVNEQRKAQLESCLRLIHLGTPSLEAFRIAFGMEPSELWNAEIKTYARNLKSRAKLVVRDLPAEDVDLDFQQQAVPQDDVQKFLDHFRPKP